MADTRGMFSKLPAELRVLIFQMCIRNRGIGLLSKSKALYAELIPQLREKFSLNLWIQPAEVDWARLVVLNDVGQPWVRSSDTLEMALNCVCAGQACDLLHQIPLEVIGKLVLWVDAPDWNNSDQCVRTFQVTNALFRCLSATWLRVMCRPSEGDEEAERQPIPPITIILREVNHRKWNFSEEWLERLPDSEAGWNDDVVIDRLTQDTGNLDVQFLLRCLNRLRKLAPVTFYFPANNPGIQKIDRLLSTLEPLPQKGLHNTYKVVATGTTMT